MFSGYPLSGSPFTNQLRTAMLASWKAIAWALLTKQPLAKFVGLFGCGRNACRKRSEATTGRALNGASAESLVVALREVGF